MKKWMADLARDAVFGAALFVVIVILTILSTKTAQFVYAMF